MITILLRTQAQPGSTLAPMSTGRVLGQITYWLLYLNLTTWQWPCQIYKRGVGATSACLPVRAQLIFKVSHWGKCYWWPQSSNEDIQAISALCEGQVRIWTWVVQSSRAWPLHTTLHRTSQDCTSTFASLQGITSQMEGQVYKQCTFAVKSTSVFPGVYF